MVLRSRFALFVGSLCLASISFGAVRGDKIGVAIGLILGPLILQIAFGKED